jgi:Mn2+/Fe2+ NRAMP family transporter
MKSIGPGALVAAAFIGPGTVTTCTVSGASYGYTMLWCLLFATVATIIFQEMAARIGIISKKGLGENIRERIPNPVVKGIAIAIVIIAIFIGNVAYETGNITGGTLGIRAINADLQLIPLVIIIGLAAFLCMWFGGRKVIEKVLTAIVVFMGVVFLVTALASQPDWLAVVKGLFTPQLPEGAGILTAVGLIGTTIVPYNLFLHASSAAQRWTKPEQIADARFDTALSIGLGGIISMSILVCAGANIYGTGVEVTNGADMAVALSPVLGDWATWLIALGLLAAGFSSAMTAPYSAAYAVNGVMGWKKSTDDIQFKIIWVVVLLLGCIMAIIWGSSPTQLILVAQAANAIILPIMAFFVMYCANSKDLGSYRNHAFANICGVVIIVITLFMCYRNMNAFITSLTALIAG